MKKENLERKIVDLLETLSDEEAVNVWDEFCGQPRRDDDVIYRMDELPELFDMSNVDGMFSLLQMFYFGSDCYNPDGSANPCRDWFTFDGSGNIISTNYPRDHIDAEELADWIIENNNALYRVEIRDLLDAAAEEEETADTDAGNHA